MSSPHDVNEHYRKEFCEMPLWKPFVPCWAASFLLAFTQVPAHAQQGELVAIGGAVTEIVYALDQQDRLLARDTTSTYPKAAQKLPDIGYVHNLSPEAVLSVAPDLILADASAGPPEAISLLRAARVNYVTVPQGFDPASVTARVTVVADALGVSEIGAVLVERIEDEFLDLSQRTSKEPHLKKRVLFVLRMQNGTVRVAGSQTPVHHMITLAGGTNVAAQVTGCKPMTDEALIEARPDVILAASYPDGSRAVTKEVLKLPVFAHSPAAENNKIIWLDALSLTGFGPRTAQIFLDLHRILEACE